MGRVNLVTLVLAVLLLLLSACGSGTDQRQPQWKIISRRLLPGIATQFLLSAALIGKCKPYWNSTHSRRSKPSLRVYHAPR